jgi:hypothetical protein
MIRPVPTRRAPRSRCAGALLMALAATLLAAPRPAPAQASLAAEDIIDEIPVKLGTVTDRFTVVRDALQTDQWYYAPTQPRLSERVMSNGRREPEFALVRYQFKDPADPEKLAEGGFLQFAMTLALPPEALPQLKAAIAARAKVKPETVRLAALPFKAATANLYVPKSGLLIASEPLGPGIAPTFSTQKMAYAISLSKIGSDVYDTLTTGTTGLATGIEFTYTGLTPPVGFTVTVDWDQAYTFYSKDEKIRAQLSLGSYFGGKVSIDRSKLVETLTQNKVITIEEIDNPENGAKYLELILNRINTELLEAMKPPEKIPEAVAGDPNPDKSVLDKLTGKFFGQAGYSVAIKDRKVVKKGKEKVTFRSRHLQERKTVAAGFVGIGGYPEDVRQRLVTVVPPGPWKSAFFILPNVGDAQEAGISQVDLELRLRKGNTTHSNQVAVWKPTGGWMGIGGGTGPRSLVAFGLMDLYQQDPTLANVKFETVTQITLKNDVLRVTDTLPVNDQRAIVTPLSAVKVLRLDATSLSWAGLAPPSKLVSAMVSLRAGDRSFTALVKPRLLDAKLAPPAPVTWIMPRTVPSVTATITFRLGDGSTINWSRNGQNLVSGQENSPDLFVDLIDADWQGPGAGG